MTTPLTVMLGELDADCLVFFRVLGTDFPAAFFSLAAVGFARLAVRGLRGGFTIFLAFADDFGFVEALFFVEVRFDEVVVLPGII